MEKTAHNHEITKRKTSQNQSIQTEDDSLDVEERTKNVKKSRQDNINQRRRTEKPNSLMLFISLSHVLFLRSNIHVSLQFQ